MKHIPNLFTLLNLFFGCIAIVYIMQYQVNNAVLNLSGFALMLGSLFIFMSAVVDFLDGFIARLFKATSAMGEQLDSLADLVSFGVAPGMIMYKLLEVSLNNYPQLVSHSLWYQLPAFILPCAGAWRLAKFNLDKEQTYYFKGVPIPAAGLTIASLPLIHVGFFNIESITGSIFIIYGIIIFMSWLMVSNIPMISLKFRQFDVKHNIEKLILICITIPAIVFLQGGAVPVVFLAYVILSLFFKPNKVQI